MAQYFCRQQIDSYALANVWQNYMSMVCTKQCKTSVASHKFGNVAYSSIVD